MPELAQAVWKSQQAIHADRETFATSRSKQPFRSLDFYRGKRILLWTRKPGLGDRAMNAICCQLLRERYGFDVHFGYWNDPSDRDFPRILRNVPCYAFRPNLKRFPLADHAVPRGYLGGRDHTGAEHPFDVIIDFRYQVHSPYNAVFQCLMEFGVCKLEVPIPGLQVVDLPPPDHVYDVVLCTSCGGWKPVRAYRRHLELAGLLRERGLTVLNLAERNVRHDVGSPALLSAVKAARVYVGAETGPTHLVSGVHRKAVVIQAGIHKSAFWNLYDRTYVVEADWECGGSRCQVRKHADCTIPDGVCIDRFAPHDIADLVISEI